MGDEITKKLINLTDSTGYKIAQTNGQRKFGPPPDWNGPAPSRGCEVFVGKLPRNCYEDELVPIFNRIGKIYELRLMMDFSGTNRGFCFVTYTTTSDAYKAIRELNNYEIRPKRFIGVVKSVDNCRLFIGGIPKDKKKIEIYTEFSRHVEGITDVIVYSNPQDKKLNRGFAFIEFDSHTSASKARRKLIPGRVKMWDYEVMVDWAEPEPDVDEETMSKVGELTPSLNKLLQTSTGIELQTSDLVKNLYIRNLLYSTSAHTIQTTIEQCIGHRIERVKKMKDFAFVHFYTREHAELFLSCSSNMQIDGADVEIKWAKPVNNELYKVQKKNRGNSKFNNANELQQTLQLYQEHVASIERDKVWNRKDSTDTEHSSGYVGCDSTCDSTIEKQVNCSSGDMTITNIQSYKLNSEYNDYYIAPIKLDAICKRYEWHPPTYTTQILVNGWYNVLCTCIVDAPLVNTQTVLQSASRGFNQFTAVIYAAANILMQMQHLSELNQVKNNSFSNQNQHVPAAIMSTTTPQPTPIQQAVYLSPIPTTMSFY